MVFSSLRYVAQWFSFGGNIAHILDTVLFVWGRKLKSWSDLQLGVFTFNQYQWEKTMALEAFSIFPYDGFSHSNGDTSSSNIEVGIEAEDENDTPSNEVVSVLRLTIENHSELLKQGIAALYNDMLGGRNLDSGMWWNSNIEQVQEIVDGYFEGQDSVELKQPSDLNILLSNPSIQVQEYDYGYNQPCSIISFEAVFEPEHGIGILTNGIEILGVGYQMDVCPFDELADD